MTLLQLAAEIEKKILSGQQYKQRYGEETGTIYLEFFESGERSITYKIDVSYWEKIKELINL